MFYHFFQENKHPTSFQYTQPQFMERREEAEEDDEEEECEDESSSNDGERGDCFSDAD